MKQPFAISCLFLLFSCAVQPVWSEEFCTSGASISNRFTSQLYSALAIEEESNVFISPFSVYSSLALAEAGSAGATRKAFARVLKADGEGDTELIEWVWKCTAGLEGPAGMGQFRSASRVWYAKDLDLKSAYLSLQRRFLPTQQLFEQLDFRRDSEVARTAINTWTAKQTANKIEELIPSGIIDARTRMVLTNAVHFDAHWMHGFREGQTRAADFFSTPASKTQVQMMYLKAGLLYVDDGHLQRVSLPYKGGAFAMLLLIPREHEDVATIDTVLSKAGSGELFSGLRKREIELRLPRFELDKLYRLETALKAMGLSKMFSPSTADFSSITSSEKLFVSKVIHKSYVRVDEAGTEAAAASGLVFSSRTLRVVPQVRADKPFGVLIYHLDSGLILFSGKVQHLGESEGGKE